MLDISTSWLQMCVAGWGGKEASGWSVGKADTWVPPVLMNVSWWEWASKAVLKPVPGGFDAQESVKTSSGDDIDIWRWAKWPRRRGEGQRAKGRPPGKQPLSIAVSKTGPSLPPVGLYSREEMAGKGVGHGQRFWWQTPHRTQLVLKMADKPQRFSETHKQLKLLS